MMVNIDIHKQWLNIRQCTIWLGRALATPIRPSGGEGAANLTKVFILKKHLLILNCMRNNLINLIGPISEALRRFRPPRSSKKIFFLRKRNLSFVNSRTSPGLVGEFCVIIRGIEFCSLKRKHWRRKNNQKYERFPTSPTDGLLRSCHKPWAAEQDEDQKDLIQ